MLEHEAKENYMKRVSVYAQLAGDKADAVAVGSTATVA
jgi:hypothetical protein